MCLFGSLRIGLVAKRQFQKSTQSEFLVGDPSSIERLAVERLAVERYRLNIAIARGLVTGNDLEFIPGLVRIVEFNRNTIKQRSGDLVNVTDTRTTVDLEQSNRHQDAEGPHLSLIFVAMITAIGSDIAMCL